MIIGWCALFALPRVYLNNQVGHHDDQHDHDDHDDDDNHDDHDDDDDDDGDDDHDDHDDHTLPTGSPDTFHISVSST